MYDKRLKVFVIICTLSFAAAAVRLAQIQLVSDSAYNQSLSEFQQNKAKPLRTVRGRILDRNGKLVAGNEPRFWLSIRYNLTSLADERFWQAELVQNASKHGNMKESLDKLQKQYAKKRAILQDVIDKCVTLYRMEPEEIETRFEQINDRVWQLRSYIAWYRNCLHSELRRKYQDGQINVDQAAAMADFEKEYPQPAQRLALISDVSDLAEMNKRWQLVELVSDEDILSAQLQFVNNRDIEVVPGEVRVYPYGSVGAQTVGWVGFVQPRDMKLFEGDHLASYTENEYSGRSGVEYVCESLLRGKRGEEIRSFDNSKVLERTENVPGRDVRLTIDFELQKQIEAMLAGSAETPTAAAVIDVASGDILCLASVPTFNIESVRQDYGRLLTEIPSPLRNRAIGEHYPPGSVIKPVILTAGLEEKTIGENDIISCPSCKAPEGWPSCMIWRESHVGHDTLWPNYARNAVKGSCNVYFSHLAERLSSAQLQKWLSKFGYGSDVLEMPKPPMSDVNYVCVSRTFPQSDGSISSSKSPNSSEPAAIADGERRFFGIGQGNLRATPLQVANAMAVISRHGMYRPPHLIIADGNVPYESHSLDISPHTLEIVRGGMRAVVNEFGGTAYRAFASSNFASDGITVYGKTGSTERPEHAWFAGFAEDSKGRSIAIAVLVEGGQLGSKDAAPLGRKILELCVDAGYIGR
jgi:penicillin-binding protein 2